MNTLQTRAKLLALTILLVGSCTVASAAVGDQVSIAGGDTYTSSTINFTGPFLTLGDTGLFSGLNAGTVSFTPGPLTYTGAGINGFLFSITNSTETLDFTSTSDTSTTSGNTLQITDTGYFSGSYFTGDLPATFTITSQGEPNGTANAFVTFSGTAVETVPEPGVSTLMALGLLATAGWFYLGRRSSGITLQA